MSRADRYFAVWAFILPITSVVVVPFVQGTTPAYLMALALVFPVTNVLILKLSESRVYYGDLAILVIAFGLLVGVAQLGVSFSGIRVLKNITLINPLDDSILLRRTIFTQSLYLLAGAATFVFVKRFYKPTWDRYFMYGVAALALYGLYEVAFFAIFRRPGDFLTNRTFGGGAWSGSLFQIIALGPVLLQRLKSLTGEPSMYAFTVLPFWIYSLHTGRRWIQWLLLGSLLLTTSSTAMLGIGLYVVIRFFRYRLIDRVVGIVAATAFALVLLAMSGNEFVLNAFEKTILSRWAVTDESSITRLGGFYTSLGSFAHEPLVCQLFGLGFGYVREANMFTTILLNLGIVGLLLTLFIFFRPIVGLGWDERAMGIRTALFVILVTMLIAVPGFEHLSVWLFLGMAYHELGRKTRKQTSGSDNVGALSRTAATNSNAKPPPMAARITEALP